MCNALWECIKCPAKVVCCCCECACKVILSILSSFIALIIIIGLIVYFTAFHNKDDGDAQKSVEKMMPVVKRSIRDYFKME